MKSRVTKEEMVELFGEDVLQYLGTREKGWDLYFMEDDICHSSRSAELVRSTLSSIRTVANELEKLKTEQRTVLRRISRNARDAEEEEADVIEDPVDTKRERKKKF